METVEIFNVSKGVIIARQARLAVTLPQRLKGLLGQESLSANEALVLKPCSSIHTFLMRFAIDVLFLDKNMQIIKLFRNIPPNRLSSIVWGSKMTIELPAGKINQTNAQIGDMLEFKPAT